MKRTYVLALLVILTGCGSQKAFVAQELRPYVNQVLGWAGEDLDGSIYDIDFGETESKAWAAVCHRPEGNAYFPHSRYIVVRKNIWDAMDEDERLETIAHELGHCQWNWEHSEDNRGLMRARNLYGRNVKTLFLDRYLNKGEEK
jgi:Zn-dependent protease with chaperone function